MRIFHQPTNNSNTRMIAKVYGNFHCTGHQHYFSGSVANQFLAAPASLKKWKTAHLLGSAYHQLILSPLYY